VTSLHDVAAARAVCQQHPGMDLRDDSTVGQDETGPKSRTKSVPGAGDAPTSLH
jgi:hypothetical protein